MTDLMSGALVLLAAGFVCWATAAFACWVLVTTIRDATPKILRALSETPFTSAAKRRNPDKTSI